MPLVAAAKAILFFNDSDGGAKACSANCGKDAGTAAAYDADVDFLNEGDFSSGFMECFHNDQLWQLIRPVTRAVDANRLLF